MRAQAHILEPERVELANVGAEAPADVTNLKNQAPLVFGETDLYQFRGCMLDGIVDGLLHDPIELNLILLFVDVRTILVRELYTHAGKGVDTFDKEVERFGKALLLEYAGNEPAVDLSEAVGRLLGEAGDLFDLVLQAVRLQRIALHDIAAEKAHPREKWRDAVVQISTDALFLLLLKANALPLESESIRNLAATTPDVGEASVLDRAGGGDEKRAHRVVAG